MIIDWQGGALAHHQEYYGIGFVLNWPGTSTHVAYAAFDEQLVSDVLFIEAAAATVLLVEAIAADVLIIETEDGEGLL